MELRNAIRLSANGDKINSKPEGAGARASWFVGASYGGTEDQHSH
jgi:hypothetical protein